MTKVELLTLSGGGDARSIWFTEISVGELRVSPFTVRSIIGPFLTFLTTLHGPLIHEVPRSSDGFRIYESWSAVYTLLPAHTISSMGLQRTRCFEGCQIALLANGLTISLVAISQLAPSAQALLGYPDRSAGPICASRKPFLISRHLTSNGFLGLHGSHVRCSGGGYIRSFLLRCSETFQIFSLAIDQMGCWRIISGPAEQAAPRHSSLVVNRPIGLYPVRCSWYLALLTTTKCCAEKWPILPSDASCAYVAVGRKISVFRSIYVPLLTFLAILLTHFGDLLFMLLRRSSSAMTEAIYT